MRIRVPATTANLGPGFDSCGLALSSYLSIEVIEEADTWQIQHHLGSEIPSDAENLLVQTALRIAPELKPHVVKMTSDIPLTRGLGSSSSVIVAGIELANRLQQLNLPLHEKIRLATVIEGHPDNVAPAFCGNLVVAAYVEDTLHYATHHFPECDVIAFIPKRPLATSESRGRLPRELPYKDAVAASAIANVMVAAVSNGNLPLAGQLMEEDRWHEPYRAALVPWLSRIRDLGHRHGAYGTFLSGAGPTVLMLTPSEVTASLLAALAPLAEEIDATVESLSVDQEGVQVF